MSSGCRGYEDPLSHEHTAERCSFSLSLLLSLSLPRFALTFPLSRKKHKSVQARVGNKEEELITRGRLEGVQVEPACGGGHSTLQACCR